MKVLPVFLLCGCVFGIGYATGSWRVTRTDSPVLTDSTEATTALEAAPLVQTVAAANPEAGQLNSDASYWKAEAEKSKKSAEEVYRLRADVSRLNSELTEARQKFAQALEKAERTVTSAQRGQASAGAKEPPNQKRTMAVAEAPAAIQAAITREFGAADVKALVAQSSEGKVHYGMKGQLPDGRYFALNLGEDGTLLEKHQQIPPETVPLQVATAIQENFGQINIGDVSQVIDGGQEYYKLTAKSAERGMEIAIRPDGTILSYSTRYRGPLEHQSKKATK